MSCYHFGFEYRAVADDGISVLIGSPSYSTTVPSGSGSLRSIQGDFSSYGDFLQGDGTLKTPSGNDYWFHAQWHPGGSGTTNDAAKVGMARNGAEHIVLSRQDNTGFITLRVAGSLVATSATAITAGSFRRVHVHVDEQTGGDVNVYVDGNTAVAVLTYTLLAGDITALGGSPNGMFLELANNNSRLDDFFFLDPNDATGETNINNLLEADVTLAIFTGNGNYTAWTGDFSNIDDIPFNVADEISTTAVDQAETFTKAAIAGSISGISAVKMRARVQRTGTDAGSNIQFRMRESATDTDTANFPAPGDGYVSHIFDLDRAGAAWTPTNFDNTEFGVVCRT